MANYLIRDATLPGVNGIVHNKPAIRKGIEVDPIYRTTIRNRSGTMSFSGYIPTDFQIAMSSGWTPLFSGSMADLAGQAGLIKEGAAAAIGAAGQLAGASSRIKTMTGQAWTEPAYLQISLPIEIHAYEDTKEEIINQLIRISKLVTPKEVGGGEVGGVSVKLGALQPPGPAAAVSILQELSGGANLTIDDEFEIICQVGKFFRMTPCVVTNVVAALNGQMEDESGNPMGVDFNLELTSYFAVTQQDIEKWFAGNFGNEYTETN